MENITIIGLGNMGGALARGLLHSSMAEKIRIRLYDLHQDRLEEFSNSGNVELITNIAHQSFDHGTVVLCVKPQDLAAVGSTLKNSIGNSVLLISILAGTRVKDVEKSFGHEGGVVRAMPNIAATIGYAATAMCSNEKCSIQQKDLAEAVLGAVGDAYWTKESLMDTVTGLSGSGPAYIFMVIEALTDGGVKMGLPRKLALQLSTQTVLGAAMLVKKTNIHPAILKEQVTTPAGTTISALHELEERGLRSMFVSAVETATERSIFLGEKAKEVKE